MKGNVRRMKLLCVNCLHLFAQVRPPWPIECPSCRLPGGIVERGWTQAWGGGNRYSTRAMPLVRGKVGEQ